MATGPFVTCQHNISITNEPIWMQIGTHSSRGKGVKWSTSGLGGQRSRSLQVRVRFEGLPETSFSILGQSRQLNKRVVSTTYNSPVFARCRHSTVICRKSLHSFNSCNQVDRERQIFGINSKFWQRAFLPRLTRNFTFIGERLVAPAGRKTHFGSLSKNKRSK